MFVTKSKKVAIDLSTIKSIQGFPNGNFVITFNDKGKPMSVSNDDGSEIVEKLAQK